MRNELGAAGAGAMFSIGGGGTACSITSAGATYSLAGTAGGISSITGASAE